MLQYSTMKPGVVKILWIIYFLCVIPALVTLYHRAQFDNGFNSVALVTDYVQLLELAQTENVPIDELLTRVHDEAGIDHIALLEDTPIFLQQRGLCTIVEGVGWPGWKTQEERDEIERNRGIEIEEAAPPENNWPLLMGLDHDKNHLIFENRDVFTRIADEAQFRYPGLIEITDLGDDGGIVSLAGEPKIVLEWGLGFDPELVENLKSSGFDIYPRLRDYAGYSEDTSKAILQQTVNDFPKGFIIFDGDSILGKGSLTEEFSLIAHDSWLGGVGWIEFAKQRGASTIARVIPDATARVHSIEDEEMEVITVERAVDRFVRSVRERTIRIVYLKPFLLQTDRENRIDKTLSMFSGVKDELENRGYVIGEPSTIRNPVHVNLITTLSAFIFLLAGLVLLFQTLGYNLTGKFTIPAFVLLVVLYSLSGLNSPALGIALVCPTLAVAWLVTRFDGVSSDIRNLRISSFWPSIFYWLGACAITLAGALLIAASSVNAQTLIAIDTFSGVKLALYLPILLAIIIGVQLILPSEKRTIKGAVTWLLNLNLQIWHVVLGGVGLVMLFVMVDRSGNFPILDVASWENDVRGWFETMLYARPRTKEMLVGHPALVMGLMLGLSNLKIRRALMYVGVVIGSIALTSMTNTFCHFHTPIMLTVWRTLGGMVIGGAIGIIAGLILLVIIKRLASTKK